jgi:hypothetical protein
MSRSATIPGSSMPVSAKDNGAGSLSWVRRLFPAVTRRGSLAGPFPESLNPVIILSWISYPGEEGHGSVGCLAHRRSASWLDRGLRRQGRWLWSDRQYRRRNFGLDRRRLFIPNIGYPYWVGTHQIHHSRRDRRDHSPFCVVADPESLNGARSRAVQCGGIGIKTGGTPGKLERRLIAASSEPCGFR